MGQGFWGQRDPGDLRGRGFANYTRLESLETSQENPTDFDEL